MTTENNFNGAGMKQEEIDEIRKMLNLPPDIEDSDIARAAEGSLTHIKARIRLSGTNVIEEIKKSIGIKT